MEDDEVIPVHNSSLQRLKLQMIEIKNMGVQFSASLSFSVSKGNEESVFWRRIFGRGV